MRGELYLEGKRVGTCEFDVNTKAVDQYDGPQFHRWPLRWEPVQFKGVLLDDGLFESMLEFCYKFQLHTADGRIGVGNTIEEAFSDLVRQLYAG